MWGGPLHQHPAPCTSITPPPMRRAAGGIRCQPRAGGEGCWWGLDTHQQWVNDPTNVQGEGLLVGFSACQRWAHNPAKVGGGTSGRDQVPAGGGCMISQKLRKRAAGGDQVPVRGRCTILQNLGEGCLAEQALLFSNKRQALTFSKQGNLGGAPQRQCSPPQAAGHLLQEGRGKGWGSHHGPHHPVSVPPWRNFWLQG